MRAFQHLKLITLGRAHLLPNTFLDRSDDRYLNATQQNSGLCSAIAPTTTSRLKKVDPGRDRGEASRPL